MTARCIVCQQEGLPAVNQSIPIQPKGTVRKVKLARADGSEMEADSGDLAHANMVGPGPGSHPDNFPGDPTGTKYYGSGAGAYVHYHPECVGRSVDEYNAWMNTITPQMDLS